MIGDLRGFVRASYQQPPTYDDSLRLPPTASLIVLNLIQQSVDVQVIDPSMDSQDQPPVRPKSDEANLMTELVAGSVGGACQVIVGQVSRAYMSLILASLTLKTCALLITATRHHQSCKSRPSSADQPCLHADKLRHYFVESSNSTCGDFQEHMGYCSTDSCQRRRIGVLQR